ncbi:MAG: DUF4398 domain-containing protein [Myxococcota bacterium]|nr:DUF4398 domain-containing protein [Myxococcota bacterium]MDW8361318.1 DUF4398 domain-containing protein [Myxococcales bacterium]
MRGWPALRGPALGRVRLVGGPLAALLFVVLLLVSGCGGMLYLMQIGSASSAIEEARAAGAPEHAPYEYYFAQAHLEQARRDAAEAEYQDAIRNAQIAERYGVKARDMARRHLREAGR